MQLPGSPSCCYQIHALAELPIAVLQLSRVTVQYRHNRAADYLGGDRSSSLLPVNSPIAELHPTTHKSRNYAGGEIKNALDGFCHSAAFMAVGLGISYCRKLDSLDPGDSFGCIGG
jgi:hypothetical protein